MKVICDRAALLGLVNLVSGVVSARSPRPALTGVLIEARQQGGAGELLMTATDAELSLVVRTDRVDVSVPGRALEPADKLRQIVSAEDADPSLTIEAEDDTCHIRGGDAHFRLLGFPPSEFPPVPTFKDALTGAGTAPRAKSVFTISAGALSSMVGRTVFAAARENSRYAINGVLLKRDGKRVEMVATDGRRLALCRGTVAGGDKDSAPVTCIIPAKALGVLLKLVGDPEESVSVAVTDSQALFAFGGPDDPRATLTTNLVEGAFPPYEEVIPKDSDRKITFDRDLVASAVRRAALLTNEESRGVRLVFKGSDKQLELSSRAAELGEAQVKVGLNDYKGDDIEVSFNPAFITDVLKVVPEPEVVLELKAPRSPGLIRSGADFLYVVMPVNLH